MKPGGRPCGGGELRSFVQARAPVLYRYCQWALLQQDKHSFVTFVSSVVKQVVYANKNSLVRRSRMVSRSLAAFSNSKRLAASRMSFSSLAT